MIRIVSRLIKKLLKNFSKKLFLVKIDGLSCFPDLIPNKIYLAQNLFQPKIGQYVVFLEEKKYLVKRLISKTKNYLLLKGKIDKKTYLIRKERILGTIWKAL